MSRHLLHVGAHVPAAPLVLAPMAGVTNAAFRAMCRAQAPDLIYVNEMVMAAAVIHRNAKTRRMMAFAPDERPRSLQIYASDPAMLGHAVRDVCDEGLVDHIDLNFGCPAAKVTRRGGGAAVPARPRLLRAVVRAAVEAAAPYGVPITAKFRMGLRDDLRTDIECGTICADEGTAWIALHARTAEQHYAGDAHWEAIAALKQAVPAIPVLGNGDIWEASDAIAMIDATGCDGVVIGRGCLGRPWLFGDLVRLFRGEPARPPRLLGEVVETMGRHAALLVDYFVEHDGACGEGLAMRDFRKHANWYMTGYPVGPAIRHQLAQVSTLAELDRIVAGLDPGLELVPGGERIKRGHTNGPIKVALPDRFFETLDDVVIPDDHHVMTMSGG